MMNNNVLIALRTAPAIRDCASIGAYLLAVDNFVWRAHLSAEEKRELARRLNGRALEAFENEDHQKRFRQWAAHRACEQAVSYEAKVKAALRLLLAYDDPFYNELTYRRLVEFARPIVAGQQQLIALPEWAAAQLADIVFARGHINLSLIIWGEEYYSFADEEADMLGRRMIDAANRRRY